MCLCYEQYIVYHKYMYYMHICDVCVQQVKMCYVTGSERTDVTYTQYTIHTAVTISYSVWAILNVSFIVNSLYGMLYMYDDTCYTSYY